MLVPLQTSGANPPLFFVHGLIGTMPMGRFLAQGLGPDQPLYAICANGIDGRETAACTVEDMASAYVEEIVGAQPNGPLMIAGLCTGGLAAIEVMRQLRARGRQVGPLILADPPTTPPGYIKRNQTIDPGDPLVANQLYQWVRECLLNDASRSDNDLPFAANDERQLHVATLAGVKSLVALSKHRPEIFPGAVVTILSFERAAGFFHPEMHWVKLLPQKPAAHILPYAHDEIFRSGRHDFARVLKFVLEGALKPETRSESGAAPTLASGGKEMATPIVQMLWGESLTSHP
jgi:thioesterase domain-containing protein